MANMTSSRGLKPDQLYDADDDHMSSLLARVSKKLGWDKFNTLQDALEDVEARTPDWKGGKQSSFFDPLDNKESNLSNKENTSSNVPSDKTRSYSMNSILQHGSTKENSSKTVSITGSKTTLQKAENSLTSPYFTTSGTKVNVGTNRKALSLSDKLSSPSNSILQEAHFAINIASRALEKVESVSVVKPKVPSVKMKSSGEKSTSQEHSGSNKYGSSQRMGSLHRGELSSGSEEDTNSYKNQSRTSPILVSSDSDDFESFVQKMKTPSRASKPSASPASLDDFIVDDSDVDSEGEDDVFAPSTPRPSDPVYVISSSSDEDEFQKGIIARFRSPKPVSGTRKSKKKGSRHVLSSSSSDEEQFEIPSWKKSTPLWKQNTPLRTEDTPLRKHILQKNFLTPQVPPGYKKPTLSVPKVSTKATRKTKSTSGTEKDLTAAVRRNSEPTSFLSSLSTPARGKPPSSPFVSDFKKNKDELVKKLFKLFNETVFDNKLPSDMSITWNNKMRKTAGFCYTGRSKLNRSTLVARIELSEKVCDSAERVRDTLIHEMCHAATWVVNGVKDGHGRFWQFWARKANHAHPSLPVITRCHTYAINTKFTYQCTECGYRVGRHSKSIDTDRQVCGYCRGSFQLINQDGTPAKARKPSKFALFVKERYGSVKKKNAGMAHKEVMRLLSAEFAAKAKMS